MVTSGKDDQGVFRALEICQKFVKIESQFATKYFEKYSSFRYLYKMG